VGDGLLETGNMSKNVEFCRQFLDKRIEVNVGKEGGRGGCGGKKGLDRGEVRVEWGDGG